jgi:protein-tyrosine phosphatase
MVFTANEIFTNLWLGDIRDSRNSEFINSIDVVINCTKNLPFINNSKKSIRVSVEDNLEKEEIASLYKYLEPITKFIHVQLVNNKKVFVHCYAGKQRSASVVCAYLMKFMDLSYKEATELIKSKRYHIFTPLPNFDAALRIWEKNITKK